MEFTAHGSGVLLTGCAHFNVKDTLECGQFFRFIPITDNEYSLTAFSRVIHIRPDTDGIYFFPCTRQEFAKTWIPFFDLERDYTAIQKDLMAGDMVIAQAVRTYEGIRIIHQDPWECLISFILSQNNSIIRIKQMVQAVCKAFGEYLSESWYSFPTPKILAQLTLDDLLSCKTGYRAKYILDAARKISSQEIDLASLYEMPSNDARNVLKSIIGVGNKIADCILLFAYQKAEVFPTDVWIKKTMERLYFAGNPTSIDAIHRLANQKFGAYAGFAQQYLFHFARTSALDKE